MLPQVAGERPPVYGQNQGLYADLQVVVTETFVPEDTLYDEADRMLAAYQIADNFYMMAQEIKSGTYSMKAYYDTDRDIMATVVAGHRRSDMDAQKVMAEGAAIWTEEGAEVESIEINGKTFFSRFNRGLLNCNPRYIALVFDFNI